MNGYLFRIPFGNRLLRLVLGVFGSVRRYRLPDTPAQIATVYGPQEALLLNVCHQNGLRDKNVGCAKLVSIVPQIDARLPVQTTPLAAADRHLALKPSDPRAKYVKTVGISRYRIIVEVATHCRPEPLSVSGHRSCMCCRSCCLFSASFSRSRLLMICVKKS